MKKGESTACWPLFPESGRGLTYTLHRSRRRTLSVEIQPHGAVHVRSPLYVSHADIEAFLLSKRRWIERRILDADRALQSIPLLPTERHVHHRGAVMEWRGTASALRSWQRAEALQLFEDTIRQMLPALGVAALRYQSLRLRTMRRRWGSCTMDGRITLNDWLIRVPDPCWQAVIAHELAHLMYMHHGPAFQHLARHLMPGYDEANRLLDQWTSVLTTPSQS
ncbi:MAG: M48 family metallopeptidase [Candidatus Kapaibacteriota bacterium]